MNRIERLLRQRVLQFTCTAGERGERGRTKDRDAATKAIDGYVATGGTALYDALSDAIARLKKVEGRRAIVVLTDGANTQGVVACVSARAAVSSAL